MFNMNLTFIFIAAFLFLSYFLKSTVPVCKFCFKTIIFLYYRKERGSTKWLTGTFQTSLHVKSVTPIKSYRLEVIIDYGCALQSLTENYGNEIESKGVQFPSRGAPDKINKGG